MLIVVFNVAFAKIIEDNERWTFVIFGRGAFQGIIGGRHAKN
jgi:hypothetical protein